MISSASSGHFMCYLNRTIHMLTTQLDIYLTQVAPSCSMAGYGGISAESERVRHPICDGAGVSRLPVPASLAGWFSMPALCGRSILASKVGVAGVWPMWPPDFGDSGDNLPGHAQAVGRLV